MELERLAARADIAAARAQVREADARTLAEQVRIVEIPAPTGGESERGDYIRGRFEEIGLPTSVDEVGNVIGMLPGSASGELGPVIVSAHLDTVFPAGTAIHARTEGTRVRAPGITDNARGLAAILRIAAAVRSIGVAPARAIAFIATVGEEGSGDLRGVKHLFRDGSPFRGAAAFIAVDGAGVTRIVNRALGAARLRATIAGPGGHSWGDRDAPNPIVAVGAAIARLRELRVTGDQPFSVNPGRIGGGTSINAIPAEAWLELDLRSDRADALLALEKEARKVIHDAVREERQRAPRQDGLQVQIERIGLRPCGETPKESHLVRTAVGVTRLLGHRPQLVTSSTDANVPISLGVPAVALGAGGRGGGIHTVDEWFENRDGAEGIERVLLIALAAADARADGPVDGRRSERVGRKS